MNNPKPDVLYATPRTFTAPNLLQIAMPMGGIGTGCVCLNGHGGLQDFSIRHHPATSALADGHNSSEPAAFAVLHIKGAAPCTKLLEGPLPPEKIYDQGLKAQGYRQSGHEGLPRFEKATFQARYPFGQVLLEDERLPLRATVTGWNPFIPLDDLNSGLPCAILEYTLENHSPDVVEFEFSYHLSHLATGNSWKQTRNSRIGPKGGAGGVLFTTTLDSNHEKFGSGAFYVIAPQAQVKTMWLRGGWFDALSALWKEVSSGQFRPNDGSGEGEDGRNGGSILVAGRLAPGESVTYPVIIAWHFPNVNQQYGAAESTACGCEAVNAPLWRPFYAGQWPDAGAVALYVAEHWQSLRTRTERFADALFSSTLPGYVLDAVACNLAILKSPTVLRQENGNLWAWEGCFTEQGCCHGTCTHVWNYAQAFSHLFPQLERTLREQEFVRSMNLEGHVNFRAALPDGDAPHNYHAAADGQLGGILKLYRDYHISGDLDWLKRLYPEAKRSLDYCIASWDPQRKGGLFEPHHNTYDIEFWGPDGMCGSIYVAALAAIAELARVLGSVEEAQPYAELAERGARLMDDELFNGEYYQQKVLWNGLRDTSFSQRVAQVTESSSESLRLLKAEGPNYQYVSGCLSDGVIGAWMAKIYGLETPLNPNNVRHTLRAIYEHNFKPDLFDHACLQRPGYALGHEAGLLLCTWPRGGKPTLPFVYSDEVWTGIEYQVASHLIEEGCVEQGLSLVKALRGRYDGHVRNPFNEYECGSYYARAMASYALLGSLSGFRYSAATKTLCFGPKISGEAFQTFFSTASGFGTIAFCGKELSVELIEGELQIETVSLTVNSGICTLNWNIRIGANEKATLRFHADNAVASHL